MISDDEIAKLEKEIHDLEKSMDDSEKAYSLRVKKDQVYDILVFILDSNEIELILSEGHAEIFGCPLAQDKIYTFHQSFSIITWSNALIHVFKKPKQVFVPVKQTPLLEYIAFESKLNSYRQNALNKKVNGPRILITGSNNSGKSSFCRFLCNYASLSKWKPVFVDLDPNLSDICLPGCIGALQINKPSCVKISSEKFISLMYGKYKMNDLFYLTLCNHLAKLCENFNCIHDGMIINTVFFDDHCLQEQIKMFQVDIVVVLGDELLYDQLLKDSNISQDVSILYQSAWSFTKKSKKDFELLRKTSIQDYFLGDWKLHHVEIVLGKNITCIQLGTVNIVPSSTLPIGKKQILEKNEFTMISEFTMDLQNRIVGIVLNKNDENIHLQPIIGYGYVSKIKDKFRLQLTIPNKTLPPKVALLFSSNVNYEQ